MHLIMHVSVICYRIISVFLHCNYLFTYFPSYFVQNIRLLDLSASLPDSHSVNFLRICATPRCTPRRFVIHIRTRFKMKKAHLKNCLYIPHDKMRFEGAILEYLHYNQVTLLTWFNARHSANSVAQAPFFLTLTIFIVVTFSQTFLTLYKSK